MKLKNLRGRHHIHLTKPAPPARRPGVPSLLQAALPVAHGQGRKR